MLLVELRPLFRCFKGAETHLAYCFVFVLGRPLHALVPRVALTTFAKVVDLNGLASTNFVNLALAGTPPCDAGLIVGACRLRPSFWYSHDVLLSDSQRAQYNMWLRAEDGLDLQGKLFFSMSLAHGGCRNPDTWKLELDVNSFGLTMLWPETF